MFNKHRLGELSQKEVHLIADLLAQLLRYRPEECISPRKALGQEWFTLHE